MNPDAHGCGLADADTSGLVVRRLHLGGHAVFRHVGPYRLLGEAHRQMREEMAKQGLKPAPPHVEIYGHWGDDESKLETEIVYGME